MAYQIKASTRHNVGLVETMKFHNSVDWSSAGGAVTAMKEFLREFPNTTIFDGKQLTIVDTSSGNVAMGDFTVRTELNLTGG
jgi:hypothetical protein